MVERIKVMYHGFPTEVSYSPDSKECEFCIASAIKKGGSPVINYRTLGITQEQWDVFKDSLSKGQLGERVRESIILTSGGDGYSVETNTLFINKKNAVRTMKTMVNERMEDIFENGDACWQCGGNRPFPRVGPIPPCPHCGEVYCMPF
jgi:hypothetical protein